MSRLLLSRLEYWPNTAQEAADLTVASIGTIDSKGLNFGAIA